MKRADIQIVTKKRLSPDIENVLGQISALKANIIKLRDENREFERIRDQYLIHLRQCMKDQETLKEIYKKLRAQAGCSPIDNIPRSQIFSQATASGPLTQVSPQQQVPTLSATAIQQIQSQSQQLLQAQQRQLLQMQQQHIMMQNPNLLFTPPQPTAPNTVSQTIASSSSLPQIQGASLQLSQDQMMPVITKHQSYLNENALRFKYSFNCSQLDSTNQMPLLGACFSHNGKIIAATTGMSTLLINSETESHISTISVSQTPQNYEKKRIAIKFSIDDQFICFAGYNCDCYLCQVQTGKVIQHFGEHKKNITAIEFSPNGKWLITGGLDGVINIWSMQTFELIKKLPQTAPIVSLVTNEEADLYAIGFKNGFVGICNCDFEPPMNNFQAHESSLTCLDLSPLTTMIATTSEDKTTKIWSIMRGPATCKHTLQFHGQNSVILASFSANDPILLTVGSDSTVALQNYKTESLLYTINLPYKEVYDLCHSPVSRMFLLTGDDNSLNVWEYGSI